MDLCWTETVSSILVEINTQACVFLSFISYSHAPVAFGVAPFALPSLWIHLLIFQHFVKFFLSWFSVHKWCFSPLPFSLWRRSWSRLALTLGFQERNSLSALFILKCGSFEHKIVWLATLCRQVLLEFWADYNQHVLNWFSFMPIFSF